MQIVDAIVTREGSNSPWANVVFLGDNGESISVRLACPVPTGGATGRARTVKRAAELLRRLVSCDSFATVGEQVWSVQTGRFGAPSEIPIAPVHTWRNGSASGEE